MNSTDPEKRSLHSFQKSELFIFVSFLLFAFIWMSVTVRLMPIDYDEVVTVHNIWQISEGKIPYTDFHEVRPPFFLFLFSPIMKLLPESFESIIQLRQINLFFSVSALLFFGLIIQKLLASHSGRLLSILALATMFVQPMVIRSFSEFRVDHLTLALTNIALYMTVLRNRASHHSRNWFITYFLFTISLFMTPKLYLISIIAFGFQSIETFKEGKIQFFKFIKSVFLGCSTASIIILLICLCFRIDLELFYKYTYVYHFILARDLCKEFGLAKYIWKDALLNPVIFVLIFAGISSFWIQLKRGRASLNAVAVSVIGFVIFQPLLVHLPFKQYVYPIYLFWSLPLTIFLEKINMWKRNAGWALGIILFAASLHGTWEQARNLFKHRYADRQIKVGNTLLDWAPPHQPVAALPPLHPLFRNNSTYSLIYTENIKGAETEKIMTHFKELSPLFSYSGYLKQLEENPPGLIVVYRAFSGKQYLDALREFVRRHSEEYSIRRLGNTPVYIRKGSQSDE